MEVICDLASEIPASSFTFGEYPFEFFNLLQSTFYPHYDKDVNVVISAATSAGKTICGELVIADTIRNGQKAIFLSPLKALTAQKLDDWQSEDHFFSKLNIEIISGDHKMSEAKAKRLKDADLILMTSEMLDTRTRYIESPANAWIKDVGVVVVDEAHLLTTNRGPALEVGLMRFSNINPESRLVLLSATMSNYSAIGEWLESLNTKETKVIASDWRPVDLNHHPISAQNQKQEVLDLLDVLLAPDEKIPDLMLSNKKKEREISTHRAAGGIPHNKTLVFVHTKKIGKDLETAIKKMGHDTQFHNASLEKGKRNKLEKKFREDMDVLISTSTLAYGLNLPARNVIIVGEQRGAQKVSPLDIAQMAGRAGRFGMYDRGDVYLINTTIHSDFKVVSRLPQTLGFHIVAELYSGNVNNQLDAATWFDKAFGEISNKLIKETFEKLESWKMIEETEHGYAVTPLGKIARDLYLDPYDIHIWNKNFAVIEDKDLWDSPSAVAWAVASDIEICSLPYTPAPLKGIIQEFRHQFGSLTRTRNETYIGVVFYQLTKENYDTYQQRHYDSAIAQYLTQFNKDSGRIFSAIKRISKIHDWNREKDLEVLQIRSFYGVGRHLVGLINIPGVGGTIATQLYQAGFRNIEDIKRNRDNLGDYIARKGNVTRILNGLKALEEA